jgi:cytochrome c oxidase subunit IV
MTRYSAISCLNRTLVVLMLATGVSYAIGEIGAEGWAAVGSVLILAFIKSRLVINEFMGLRFVRLRWKLLMLGWLVAVLGLIALAYRVGAG